MLGRVHWMMVSGVYECLVEARTNHPESCAETNSIGWASKKPLRKHDRHSCNDSRLRTPLFPHIEYWGCKSKKQLWKTWIDGNSVSGSVPQFNFHADEDCFVPPIENAVLGWSTSIQVCTYHDRSVSSRHHRGSLTCLTYRLSWKKRPANDERITSTAFQGGICLANKTKCALYFPHM